MNEQAKAEQFSQLLDNALRIEALADNEALSSAYGHDMEIVQALIAADFSAESQVRHKLKRQLLSAPIGEKETRMKTQLFQRSFVRLAVIGILIAFLLLAVSPFGATMAQSLIQIVKSWQVGEHTTAVSVEGDFEAVQGEDGSTVIQPASEMPETFEEEAVISEAEGQPHLVLDPTASFDSAQRLVNFTLRQPTFIPEGYVPQGVVVINEGQASVEYINEQAVGLIGLLQTAVGGKNGDVQITFSSDTATEAVQVSGTPALWAITGDMGLLMWEVDGVNYQLMGLSDLELVLQMANSLQ